ncbi:hypothetical protein J6590_031299 [Homalodisca vitripennis]|nr:hypothetical protein J6590_031299 [Homalodisca vitripennis]
MTTTLIFDNNSGCRSITTDRRLRDESRHLYDSWQTYRCWGTSEAIHSCPQPESTALWLGIDLSSPRPSHGHSLTVGLSQLMKIYSRVTVDKQAFGSLDKTIIPT